MGVTMEQMALKVSDSMWCSSAWFTCAAIASCSAYRPAWLYCRRRGMRGSVMNLVRSGVMIAAAVVVCMAHLVA